MAWRPARDGPNHQLAIQRRSRNMKKLMLAAILCVAAFGLAPVASASAAVKGYCQIEGEAKLNEELTEIIGGPFGALTPIKYKFVATKTIGTCVEANEVGGVLVPN